MTNEPFDFSNAPWAGGQPNNAGSGMQDRIHFLGAGQAGNTVDDRQPTWNDIEKSDSTVLGYVVEFGPLSEQVLIDDDFDDADLATNNGGVGTGWLSTGNESPPAAFSETASAFHVDGTGSNNWAGAELSSRESFVVMHHGAGVTARFSSGNVAVTNDNPKSYAEFPGLSAVDFVQMFGVVSANEGKSTSGGSRIDDQAIAWANTEGGVYVTLGFERESGDRDLSVVGNVVVTNKTKSILGTTDATQGVFYPATFSIPDYHVQTGLVIDVHLDDEGWHVEFSEPITAAARAADVSVDGMSIRGDWTTDSLDDAAITDEFNNGAFVSAFMQHFDAGRGVGDLYAHLVPGREIKNHANSSLPLTTTTDGQTTFSERIIHEVTVPALFERITGQKLQGERHPGFTVTVAGDVNGDGLDDVLMATPTSAVVDQFENLIPPIGAAYVVLGRPDPPSKINLGRESIIDVNETTSDLELVSVSFGGGVFALGDINGDGYDDFAVSRTREDSGRQAGAEGGLLVFLGKPDYRADGTSTLIIDPNPKNILDIGKPSVADYADLVLHQLPDDVAAGLSAVSQWSATAGDFDRDGRTDLAVGIPSSRVVTGTEVRRQPDGSVVLQPDPVTVVDEDEGGQLNVFFNAFDESQRQVYFNDFEQTVTDEWSKSNREVTPRGKRGFLGQFGDEAVSLSLDGLPEHTSLSVEFDLLVLRSWDGNDTTLGPEVWDLSIDGGATLLHTSFSNAHPDTKQSGQAYPGTHPADSNPARFSAVENDSLGFAFQDDSFDGPLDSVYHLSFTLPHDQDSLQLDFSAMGLEALTNESWGLDNVRVVADTKHLHLDAGQRVGAAAPALVLPDVSLAGEGISDGFGSVSGSPNLDLDGDRHDDLLVTASRADNVAAGQTQVGKVYALYGTGSPGELNAHLERAEATKTLHELTNRTIAGSGSFVEDKGRALVRRDGPDVLPGKERFALTGTGNARPRLYRFKTLGDGMADDLIRLSPAAQTTTIHPLASGSVRFDGATLPSVGFRAGVVGVLEFDLLSLAHLVKKPDPSVQMRLELPFSSISPAPSSETVDTQVVAVLVSEEADGAVTSADAADVAAREVAQFTGGSIAKDATAPAGWTATLAIPWERLGTFLRSGRTRITLLLRLDGTDVQSIGVSTQWPRRASLEVTVGSGVVADLFDATGGVVARGKSTISLEGQPAGTYYLRVYQPDQSGATSSDPLPFTMHFDAPVAGNSHETATWLDRDTIRGGLGDDTLVGNHGADRMFGQSGKDVFVGEAFERHDDFEDDEEAKALFKLDKSKDREELFSSYPPPVLRTPVEFKDDNLRATVAQALGLPVTASYHATPQPVVNMPIYTADMASLTRLDLAGLDITDLTGLEYAVNLVGLSLAGNPLATPGGPTVVDNLSRLVLRQADNGIVTGMARLEDLSLDANANYSLSTIAPIDSLATLKRLSLDYNITDLNPVSTLENLELLSIDHAFLKTITEGRGGLLGVFTDSRGLAAGTQIHSQLAIGETPNQVLQMIFTGELYIDQPGETELFVSGQLDGTLLIDGRQVLAPRFSDVVEESVGKVSLSRGWHDLRFEAYPARKSPLVLSYRPVGGDKQVIPTSVLRPAGLLLTDIPSGGGPVHKSITPHVNLSSSSLTMLFEGQVFIPVAGKVSFHVDQSTTDAGSLLIDGEVVVDAQLGAASGTVDLTAGWHDLFLVHTHAGEKLGPLVFSYTLPGQQEQLIPTSALRPPVGLNGLTGLNNLEVLSLSYNKVEDITPLDQLEHLQVLRLDHNEISNIETLARRVGTAGTPSSDVLIASPNPLVQGDPVTLAAAIDPGPDRHVAQVDFYRDADGDGKLDVDKDELLDSDGSQLGGWSATVRSANFSLGPQTYFAHALNGDGHTINTVATRGIIRPVPELAGLLGGYYEIGGNMPTPLAGRVDRSIDFRRGFGGITENANGDIGVRWSGQVLIETAGAVVFATESSGENKLFIGGVKVIDSPGGSEPQSGTIALAQGWHDLRLEYAGGAQGSMTLSYRPVGGGILQTIPADVLRPAPGEATAFYSDRLIDPQGAAQGSAQWQFTGLTPGRYEVWATWPGNEAHAATAIFQLSSLKDPATGLDLVQQNVPVNQRVEPDGQMLDGRPWQRLDVVEVRSDTPIGNNPDARYNEPFKGRIDEVRIWNRPLGGDEIRANMHRVLPAHEPGLVDSLGNPVPGDPALTLQGAPQLLQATDSRVEVDSTTGAASGAGGLVGANVDQNVDGLIELRLVNPTTAEWVAINVFGSQSGSQRKVFIASSINDSVLAIPGPDSWQYNTTYRFVIEAADGTTTARLELPDGTDLASHTFPFALDTLGPFHVALVQFMGIPSNGCYADVSVDRVQVSDGATLLDDPFDSFEIAPDYFDGTIAGPAHSGTAAPLSSSVTFTPNPHAPVIEFATGQTAIPHQGVKDLPHTFDLVALGLQRTPDADGQAVYFTAHPDDPHLTATVNSENLTLTLDESSDFTGTTRITLVAHHSDGTLYDGLGRTDKHQFDVTVGQAAFYGTVFNDADRSGSQDTGEGPLEGWTVYADADMDVQPDDDESSFLTDINGEYVLTDLTPGQMYRVTEVPQQYWDQTNGIHQPGFSFLDFRGAGAVTVVGDAAQSGNVLHLTPEASQKTGAAWYPAHVAVGGGFETRFRFQIGSQTSGGGEGFAFVIQDILPNVIGRGGDGIGYDGMGNTVAIEFDTRVSTDQSDPSGYHISVQRDVFSDLPPNSNSAHHDYSVGSAFASNMADGKVHEARIVYTQNTLIVWLDPDDDATADVVVNNFYLSSYVNDPENVTGLAYIGYTAATGDGYETHDILNWSFLPGSATFNEQPRAGDVIDIPGLGNETQLDAGPDIFTTEGQPVTLEPDVDTLPASFNRNWTVRSASGDVVVSADGDSLPFPADDSGIYEAEFTAQGGDPWVIVRDTLQIVVENSSPVVDLDSRRVAEGTVQLQAAVVDETGPDDRNSLTFQWSVKKDDVDFTLPPGTATDQPTFSFIPPDNGRYDVTLTVTDDDEESAQGDMTATVNNVAPALVPAENMTVDEGTPVSLSAAGRYADPAGDADPVTFQWTVTDSSGQPVAGGTDAGFSFTPNNQDTYTITLEVTDDDGDSHSDDLVLAVSNVPPGPIAPPPTSMIDGPVKAREGDTVTFTATLADPGSGDPHTYQWTVESDNGQSIAPSPPRLHRS